MYFNDRRFEKSYKSGELQSVRFHSENEQKQFREMIKPALAEFYKQYVDQLPSLSAEDRKIVDRVKEFYFSRKHFEGHFFVRNWNKLKTFDELRMKQLIRRAALEIFQSGEATPYIESCFQELGFITEKQQTIIEKELDKDDEMQFLKNY